MPALCHDCCILFCHVLSSALFLPATEGIDAVHDVGLLDGWVLSSRGNVERNKLKQKTYTKPHGCLEPETSLVLPVMPLGEIFPTHSE